MQHPQIDSEKMANTLLYGSRCLLSHINMSPAALEQCVIDIFANQTIENIQRIRRHGSYQKSEVVPKMITASCRNFHSGVPNALNQLIVKKQNGKVCFGRFAVRKCVFQLGSTVMGKCSSGQRAKRCTPSSLDILTTNLTVWRLQGRHCDGRPFWGNR